MAVAYVDTSAIVALVFGETGAEQLAQRMNGFSHLISSNLLEAELRAACHREERAVPTQLLDEVSWIINRRPLSREMVVVLNAGLVRGADLWHLATALHIAPQPRELSFVTRDRRQAQVAGTLGFTVS